jgi:hypothetical protein
LLIQIVALQEYPYQSRSNDPVNAEYKQENQVIEIGGKPGQPVFSYQLVAEHNYDASGDH